jgi:hypothetical protein
MKHSRYERMVTVWVFEDLYRRLTAHAGALGVPKSELIRRYFAEGLDRDGAPRAPLRQDHVHGEPGDGVGRAEGSEEP